MNIFGKLFKITLFGESHSKMIGVIISGMPPGYEIKLTELQNIIDKRKSGAKGTTKRKEDDIPIISSGIFNNRTTGAPISIFFENKDIVQNDYAKFKEHPRPGHSDFVANIKYNSFNDYRGGGMFSGRLTLAIVAASYFAKLITDPIIAESRIVELHNSTNFEEEIEKAIEKNDSIGGIIETKINNVPIGLGEPYFHSVESMISQLAFSIPGIKGIEFGAGFASTKKYGSENNDLIINSDGETKTNNSGGINAGISNGNEILFRTAIKPTSSISLKQETFNFKNQRVEELEINGRHDVCFALRMPVILEAISYIAFADLKLIKKSYSL